MHLLLVLALVLSQAKTPQKDTARGQAKQGTATKQQRADTPTVTVKLLNTGESTHDSAQKAAEVDRAKDLQRWEIGSVIATVGLTLGLLIVAGLQFFTMRDQHKTMVDQKLAMDNQEARMRETVERMTEQLQMMQLQDKRMAESYAHMRETAQRELRAYVSVTASGIRPGEFGDGGNIWVTFRNTGKTPAYAVNGFFMREMTPRTEAFSVRPIPPPKTDYGSMLGPDAETIYNRPFTAAEAASVRAETHSLWLYGRLDYTDAFGEKRYTHVRMAWRSGRIDVRSLSRDHTGGNDGN